PVRVAVDGAIGERPRRRRVGEREGPVGGEREGGQELGAGLRLTPDLDAADAGTRDTAGERERSAAHGHGELDARSRGSRGAVPLDPGRREEEVVARAGRVDRVAL